MPARSALALFRRRLGVWLVAALALWGAGAPVLVRAQAAGAGLVGMEVCTAMAGGMRSDAPPPGEDPLPGTGWGAQCPWCLLAMDLALPVPGLLLRAAALAPAAPAIDRGIPLVRSAWIALPPPRGPPVLTTL